MARTTWWAATACVALFASALVAGSTSPAASAAATTHTMWGFAASKHLSGDRYDVRAYLYPAGGGANPLDIARTDADEVGYYSFEVPDGDYRICVYDQAPFDSQVAGECLSDAVDLSDAATIRVAGADVHLPDILLDQYPRFSGKVVDQDGAPVRNVGVTMADHQGIYTHPDGPWAWVDSNGQFTLPVITPNYALFVNDLSDRHAPEWYADQSFARNAARLRAGPNPAFRTIVVGPGSSISGTVRDTDGVPARKISVTLRSTDVLTTSSEHTATDIRGSYRFEGLPAGPYRLEFYGGYGEFVDYEDAAVSGATTSVAWDDHAIIDVTLQRRPRPAQPGPAVTGQVFDADGRPARGVRVIATPETEDTNDPLQMETLAQGWTDPDGRYRLTFPGAGASGTRVHVYFEDLPTLGSGSEPVRPSDRELDLVSTFLGGHTYQEATAVTVPLVSTALPPVSLGQLGAISGRMLLADGTAPLQGIAVQAWTPDGRLGDTTTISRDGLYLLERLRPGPYKVRFASGSSVVTAHPGSSQSWWQDATTFETAAPVTVSAGETVSDISATVTEPQRPVSGRIVDPTGRAVTGVAITITSTSSSSPFSRRVSTDAQGRFSADLSPGQYKVQVGDTTESRFRPTWYGGQTHAAATTVVVVERQPPQDLGSITVSPYPVIAGRVTDLGGLPIPHVTVTAFRADGTVVGQPTTSLGNGTYRLRFDSGGTYRVGFSVGGGNPMRYYRDAITLATATALTVADEQTLGGIDQVLPLGTPPATEPPSGPPTTTNQTASTTRAVARYRPASPERHARIVIRVAVKAGGSTAPTGQVTIREGTRVLAVLPTRRGRATLRLTRFTKGLHRYVALYEGPSSVTSSSDRTNVWAGRSD